MEGWGACDPANPKNRRRRCSVLVERSGPQGATVVLIDTSPDLRDQLINAAAVPQQLNHLPSSGSADPDAKVIQQIQRELSQ